VGRGGDDFLIGAAGEDIMNGGGGADLMLGGSGFDVLLGSTGNDTLTGGTDTADAFIFQDGFGADEVTDFEATNDAEKLDVSAVSAITFTDYASFETAHLSTQGSDVLLTAGADTILIRDVTLAALDQNDFVF
jgi:Ca2+-binding RTX toxin-like protein